MQIIVNGESRTAPAGQTVLELIDSLGLKPDRVAIELDRTILKNSLWNQTELRDGSRLEIVQFVGGG